MAKMAHRQEVIRIDHAESQQQESRFDFAVVHRKPTRTPQGFLRVDARLARTGVQVYRRADGTEYRELRLPSEVFDDGSLATLKSGVPVTDLHPPTGMVTPKNVVTLSRGVVTGDVKADADAGWIDGTLIVQDAALIEAVERGDRREVSCGYKCHVEHAPGRWDGKSYGPDVQGGEAYDGIQRGIVFNHVAIGPRGWARAGSEAALRMDSGLVSYESKSPSNEFGNADPWEGPSDPPSPIGVIVRDKLKAMDKGLGHLAEALGVDLWAVRSFIDGSWGSIRSARAWNNPDAKKPPETGLAKREDFETIANFLGIETNDLFDLVPATERGDGKTETQRNDTMETVTIKIDGVDYTVPKAVAPHLENAFKAAQAKADGLQTKLDEALAKVSAESARADNLQSDLDKAKADLAAAVSPGHIDGIVKARVELESFARSVLGADAKLDGKDNIAVKREVVAKFDAKTDLSTKDEAYLDARIDHVKATLTDAAAHQDGRAAAAKAVIDIRSGKHDLKLDSEKARKDHAARGAEAWKAPLAATK